MADKLKFSLDSPERELFTGEVDQVDVPGTEGDLGILPNHSPLMAAIRTGALSVYSDGIQNYFFVQSGFADVTPEGLTVLAEKAVAMDELNKDELKMELEAATAAISNLEGEAALAAQQNIDGLTALIAG